ncbi:Small glutamine-rich tetratricopeptide repeat-containing protein beta [Grifola frondosa]|uniref:Small glutamine-rich tetratricopeptide repeat-containing protein beta n=1 Tax=Grifola frondosa TaxID=5627 RepID=A0A1C7MP27_GRIFR|nr:Small glutamine-rich tetratricopeptide repeat-containing protein beta [Grifola frondosa]
MSSTPSERKAQAEQLKAEGNRLHLRGDHTAAYEKYSKAIEVDGQNAVLYANRAAASLAMKDYLDAAFDAQEAVKIDPAYAKAWARLAKASHELRVYDKSIGAWDKAIACLPESGLPDSQLKFRQQCVDGLKATREMQTKVRERATRTFESSAWVIMNAWRDFSEGVRIMKLSRPSPAADTISQAIDCICNGILRDPRVFYMDSPNWLELFNIQVAFETGLLEGWRLESVRWALSNTVRTMFLKAYFLDYSGDSVETAIQFYDHAISILEWERRKWHDVPMSDRGVIFEKTFIRCVKRMRMEAYRNLSKIHVAVLRTTSTS